MRQVIISIVSMFILGSCSLIAGTTTDTFGTGDNQFTIDFVPISGDASSANGTNISQYSPGDSRYREFTDPGHDYRVGMYEITNDQWDKFKAQLGVPVTGSPSTAYDSNPYWTGTNVPTNRVSWYEAAQFVNWLNTSTNHAPAYTFTGTQGTGNYTLGVWGASEAWGGTNLFRHKDAYYFLPSEDEWVKAAYWNGASLQTWATVGDVTPTQAGWNFYDNGYATDPYGPWAVGTGTEELNGTYDMMGNVWEWMESPYYSGNYISGSNRGFRGGSYDYYDYYLKSSGRYYNGDPDYESGRVGFRVASVPEPCSLVLLSLGGLMLRKIR